MATKRRWRWLLTVGVLLVGAAVGWGFFGPRERSGTNLTNEEYTAR
jgi:hypothetical protein